MDRWHRLVRLVALALAFFAGVEVLACDLVSPEFCKLSAGSHGDKSDQPSDGADNCLCCCTHYVAPSGIQLIVFMNVGSPEPLKPAMGPLPEPTRILHPPRV